VDSPPLHVYPEGPGTLTTRDKRLLTLQLRYERTIGARMLGVEKAQAVDLFFARPVVNVVRRLVQLYAAVGGVYAIMAPEERFPPGFIAISILLFILISLVVVILQ
jgi:hypothetical protein